MTRTLIRSHVTALCLIGFLSACGPQPDTTDGTGGTRTTGTGGSIVKGTGGTVGTGGQVATGGATGGGGTAGGGGNGGTSAPNLCGGISNPFTYNGPACMQFACISGTWTNVNTCTPDAPICTINGCQKTGATGGTTGTGGTAGVVGTGGTVGTGGVTSTGGKASTGGATGTGGVASTGGVTSTGGTTGTGGSAGNGGAGGLGGQAGAAGNGGVGGAAGAGGSAGKGGQGGTHEIHCDISADGNTVTYTLIGDIKTGLVVLPETVRGTPSYLGYGADQGGFSWPDPTTSPIVPNPQSNVCTVQVDASSGAWTCPAFSLPITTNALNFYVNISGAATYLVLPPDGRPQAEWKVTGVCSLGNPNRTKICACTAAPCVCSF